MIEISRILDVEEYVKDRKAIIFDLDDTLYGEKEYVRSGFRKTAEALPQVENAEKRLWDLFEAGKPAIDELLMQEGIDSEEWKQTCLKAYRNQIPDIHLYTGVYDMLRRLKGSHLLGLITDGRPEGQRAKIKALNLETVFDHIIVTDELGGTAFRKPNPAAYEQMAERLGVLYEQMCYIGDNIRKDFMAPEKLGIQSIWFKNEDGLYRGK